MKKTIIIMVTAFFLALSLGARTAQPSPSKRIHTRPPYSGPSKAGQTPKKHGRPTRLISKQGKGSTQQEKPKSDHIVVR